MGTRTIFSVIFVVILLFFLLSLVAWRNAQVVESTETDNSGDGIFSAVVFSKVVPFLAGALIVSFAFLLARASREKEDNQK